MLHYEFMRIALVVGILLGISIPLVGSTAVFKRLSASGDALAHSSLAGVAIGLAAGLNPLIISIIACVVSFLIIEIIRKRFAKYSELGVAVVLSLSVGLAGILMNYSKTGNIESYLFGSILLVNNLELYLAIGMTVLVIIFYVLFHSQIFSYIYNESEAKVQGVKVGALNFVHQRLDTLFELSPVFCSGDHKSQVKRDDSSIHENLWNSTFDYTLRKPFDNSRLTDARLA